jgi:hypothetical protein
MTKGICSICDAPVRAEIDAALRKGDPLRQLEARSGFSRSALSRHSRKCLAREAVAEHKNRKVDLTTQLVWTEWPNGELVRLPAPYSFRGVLRDTPGENDVILKVEFASPVAPRVIAEKPAEIPAE